MIRAFVDYALNNRFIVVVVAVLLLARGAIAFHNLPVEAYPDVANNYVQVITQWPGHAAEQVRHHNLVVGGIALVEGTQGEEVRGRAGNAAALRIQTSLKSRHIRDSLAAACGLANG